MSQLITQAVFDASKGTVICDGCFQTVPCVTIQAVPKYDVIALTNPHLKAPVVPLSPPAITTGAAVPTIQTSPVTIQSLIITKNFCWTCLSKLGVTK